MNYDGIHQQQVNKSDADPQRDLSKTLTVMPGDCLVLLGSKKSWNKRILHTQDGRVL